MAPTYKASNGSKTGWWEDAYKDVENIHVQYELTHGKDIIKPGTLIKIKHERPQFKFRCLVHNTKTNTTWIECVEVNGAFRAFRIEKLKGVVKAKKSRRRKPNV